MIWRILQSRIRQVANHPMVPGAINKMQAKDEASKFLLVDVAVSRPTETSLERIIALGREIWARHHPVDQQPCRLI
jgi:hypothetical protein